MFATVVALLALRGLLAQGHPVGKFSNVTEKSKSAAEISATKDFIIATANLLNELHRHNLTDKTKIITITKNFISTTESFVNKINGDISTDNIANVTPLPVTISPETLPIPQRQVVLFPAVSQVPAGETLQRSEKIIRAVLSSALRKMTKGEIRSRMGQKLADEL